MTHAIVETVRRMLEDEYKAASAALRAVPGVSSRPNGLTPDSVKFSQPYRAAKLDSSRAFQALRTFNAKYKRGAV